jgi:hypothetical protein
MLNPICYFAPLVPLPRIIEAPGLYRTRAGELVTIEAASSRHRFECRGTYQGGMAEAWHPSGRLYASTETANDIIGPG